MENNINKRAANFSKDECWRLLELVERYAHVVENKKTDALTWRDKKNGWQNIATEFNSSGTQFRTWEQLRSKFETLKKETRRAVAKERTDTFRTGGGPSESQSFNPLHEKIRRLIKLSCDGIPATFDSDFIEIEMIEAEETIQDAIDDNALSGISIINTNEPTCVNLIPTGIEQKENVSMNNIEVNNWSSYSPSELKKPKHPALQVEKRNRQTGYVNLSAAGKKIQPWVDAKTELTQLKAKLIQEEFDNRQKREKELHEQQLILNSQQIEINKLILQKMNFEIQNQK